MLYKINTEFKKYSTIDSIKSILEELEQQKDEITVLDLSMNTFVPEVFKELSNAIKQLKSLKKVKLESILDSLTFEEACNILDTLSCSLPRDICSFELPSNAVSCNFPESFGKFLQECTLCELSLHNCGLGEDGLKRIAKYLAQIKNKDNLVSLDLSKNRINVICDEFTDVFSQFKNLSRFILNANTISEKSMASFLKNIQNTKLEVLNLADNFVCGDAIEHLGNLFLKNNIKELYLQDIKSNDGDINKLLEIVCKKNRQKIPGGLDESKSELILDLSCNSFDQDCVKLLEDLAESYKFKELSIFDNDYDDIEELKRVVQEDGGFVREEEDEEIELVDNEILEKFKSLCSEK